MKRRKNKFNGNWEKERKGNRRERRKEDLVRKELTVEEGITG